ncbi:MAG: ATP-binding cassette domain-containing protein [Acidimicrobiia bacterium]|nr:ATP-binding cassette domain-containing protein [Acidimicrobiia bacterium]
MAADITGAGDTLLDVQDVELRFGGIVALQDVSLAVPRGLVVGIIGPNGAGKTSLLNCINGFYRPQSGSITFDGTSLLGLHPWEVAATGISRTFQNIELVDEASAVENIMVGRHRHMRRGVLAATLFWGRGRREEVEHREKVEELIDFLDIGRLRNRPAGSLAAGQRKLVEIGRALASEPKLLLLDEPSSGMTTEEKEDVARFIVRMKRESGLTQVLIEHDIRFVSDLCDLVYVLDFGRRIAAGPPAEVMQDEAVVAAYLGRSEEDDAADASVS